MGNVSKQLTNHLQFVSQLFVLSFQILFPSMDQALALVKKKTFFSLIYMF